MHQNINCKLIFLNNFLAANLAVGYLARLKFAKHDSSKIQLLTKVSVLSDVYDNYVNFSHRAWNKLQELVEELAKRSKLPASLNRHASRIVMEMVQSLIVNRTVSKF